MKENINGVSIHYRTEGENGSKVLLLHGWGCDMTMMQPVAEALKQTHNVLLVDFPGHGQSDRPPEPWGVPEYAECLCELLQRLSFFPCSVIAHSFGCRIATWLEKEKPSLFHKIVFTGAAGIRPQPSAEAQKKSKRYQKLKQYSEMLKKLPLMKSVAEDMQNKLRQRYGSRDYNALDEEMRRTFVKVIQLDLTEYYACFHSSTLLIWGDADTETPLWMAKEMEKRIPDCGLVVLEGGSHFAYLEQIFRFNTIVRQFLKEDE
jgi:pimeloyl-ACP methyl ester carboxylesterase